MARLASVASIADRGRLDLRRGGDGDLGRLEIDCSLNTDRQPKHGKQYDGLQQLRLLSVD
jgi:hypothetical protein